MNSSIVLVGVTLFPLPRLVTNFSVTAAVRLKTATGNPFDSILSARFFAHHCQADQANIRLHRHDFGELVLRCT